MRALPTKKTRRTKTGEPVWLRNLVRKFQAQIECHACKRSAQTVHAIAPHFQMPGGFTCCDSEAAAE